MNDFYPFQNQPLPYPYDALEPYIDQKTMELHHDKHLQTYIDQLNRALIPYPRLQTLSLEQLIQKAGSLPKEIGEPIANNAGGVYNHRLYFAGIRPPEEESPVGELSEAIDRTYGSFDAFKQAWKAAGLSVFGSGYVWLTVDPRDRLKMATTANQNTPLTSNLCPVLTMDVWEHAYYLKHYNKRGDYIDDWFRVVDWKAANENYLSCIKSEKKKNSHGR